MKKLVLSFLLLIFGTTQIIAQIDDIKKNVEKDKNTAAKSSSTEGNSSSKEVSSGFILFIADIFIHTFGAAQMAVLENKDLYPERVSLEVFGNYGTENSTTSTTNYWQTGLRANWGIFASDFKYSVINDRSDDLKSIDWLVVVFRIPIKNFKIDYGLGFISLVGLDQSYFKSSVGFDWRLPSIGLNFSSAYQWSERTSLGSRYKENFIFRVDFKAIGINKLHISPMLEYNYQNYFNETTFSFYSAGVVVRLF